jgi:hypothetical protein
VAFHRHGADKNGRATDTKCGATGVSPLLGSLTVEPNRLPRASILTTVNGDDGLGQALAFV